MPGEDMADGGLKCALLWGNRTLNNRVIGYAAPNANLLWTTDKKDQSDGATEHSQEATVAHCRGHHKATTKS